MYDYGARYYDPRISIWYGTDKLLDKYPSLSPYAYCANNPIIYVDPDGKEIVVGSWVDRALNSVGYKTSNMQKLESLVTTLKSTSTGNSLYNKLDSKKEKINLVVGKDLKTEHGNKAGALTSFTGGFDKDDNLVISSDITVKIDVETASEDKNKHYGLEGDEGAVTSVAHEFGHIEAITDDPSKETVTNELKHGEGNNAEQVQVQVANEIKANKDEK